MPPLEAAGRAARAREEVALPAPPVRLAAPGGPRQTLRLARVQAALGGRLRPLLRRPEGSGPTP